MVWILRSRTRTLAKWVMSPANLKMFIFARIGSEKEGRSGFYNLQFRISKNRFQAALLRTPPLGVAVAVAYIQAQRKTSEHGRFGVTATLLFFYLNSISPLISTIHHFYPKKSIFSLRFQKNIWLLLLFTHFHDKIIFFTLLFFYLNCIFCLHFGPFVSFYI